VLRILGGAKHEHSPQRSQRRIEEKDFFVYRKGAKIAEDIKEKTYFHFLIFFLSVLSVLRGAK